MSELKTLKDLRNRPLRSGDDSKVLDYLLLEKEIKAEAVKWVKRLRDEKEPMYMDDESVEEAFIEFFNLTEEDLE